MIRTCYLGCDKTEANIGTVVPTKIDSDVIFCLQVLSKIELVHSNLVNANRLITCVLILSAG